MIQFRYPFRYIKIKIYLIRSDTRLIEIMSYMVRIYSFSSIFTAFSAVFNRKFQSELENFGHFEH